MTRTNAIFIGGTGSHVGKSILTAGFLGIYQDRGFRCCPFKAQNMSRNAYVTAAGGEMGIAQALQAKAACQEPDVRMNPVLLKPCGENRSELIVLGKSRGIYTSREYFQKKEELKGICQSAYDSLAREYDLMIIEGAGSLAEFNLWNKDIVNLPMAEYAGARVILVADMERGGALASVYGHVHLLPAPWRSLLSGFVFNKFRGDESLLAEGILQLEKKTGISHLGTLPFLSGFHWRDEDTYTSLENLSVSPGGAALLRLGVVPLPHASLLSDLDPFRVHDNISLEKIASPRHLENFDVIILPGSKNTFADRTWLTSEGWDTPLKNYSGVMLGICGGAQIMGGTLSDPLGAEGFGPCQMEGLGKWTAHTHWREAKTLGRRVCRDPWFGEEVEGYEIHYGVEPEGHLFFGALPNLGTYLHGLFDRDVFRKCFLEAVYRRKTGRAGDFSAKGHLSGSLEALKGMLQKNFNWQSWEDSAHRESVPELRQEESK